MEKRVHIPMDEIVLLRLTCRRCGTAFELPIDQVSRRIRSTDCPVCNEQLFAHERPTAVGQFALAVQEVLREQDHVLVELVIPNPE